MAETLEARTANAEETRECKWCGETYNLKARLDSEAYRSLREKVMFGVNAADCCGQACMMMEISRQAHDEHIKY